MVSAAEFESLQRDIVEWRREVHRRPETGMHLPETTAFVKRVMSEIGVRDLGARTGVVGLIEGARQGKCIAIRADMDALPVQEDTGLPFASEKPGAMHACGHDAHVAMALGAAKILAGRSETLAGSVKFIFEPDEEVSGGALPMIREGVLENPAVGAILACHVGNIWPEARTSGAIGVRFGTMMASCDDLTIRIRGKGGHGAMPHLAVDPVLVAGHVITALQSIVSREVKPTASGVVTIGKISGGFARNVIAPEVLMEGTIRALDPTTRDLLCNRTGEIARSVAAALRAEADAKVNRGYPPAINDHGFTGFFQGVAERLFGGDFVREIPESSMGAESMAYFLERVPGTLFGLGTQSDDVRTAYPHHNPRFDIDEGVLWKGAVAMAETAVAWLAEA
ncbi:MAG: M20 metallopeptidase family protein [Ignavibacteriales bacterium]